MNNVQRTQRAYDLLVKRGQTMASLILKRAIDAGFKNISVGDCGADAQVAQALADCGIKICDSFTLTTYRIR